MASRACSPPYDRQLAAQLTADEQYREVAGPGGSIQWLRNNNAYYRYRLQSVDRVENFAVQGDRASIAVQITEDSSLFVDGRRDTSREEYTTMRVRYALQREGGNWKIANTEILNK
ncbi:MAG: ARC6/PARC6 family protein [Cyanobacteria bacterium J06639_1]